MYWGLQRNEKHHLFLRVPKLNASIWESTNIAHTKIKHMPPERKQPKFPTLLYTLWISCLRRLSNYLALQCVDFDHTCTWLRLFQKCLVYTNLCSYVIITITGSIPLLVHYLYIIIPWEYHPFSSQCFGTDMMY